MISGNHTEKAAAVAPQDSLAQTNYSDYKRKEELMISTKGVSVVARFRPPNEKEISISNDMCVNFIDKGQVELVSLIENSKYKFSFDRIFSPQSSQREIFEVSSKPIIYSVLEGFNGTILAYGQTSSGKTFTMQGAMESIENQGIIPRAINLLFESILSSPEEIEFTVKVSMLEIYMEKIRDLIDTEKTNLNIREDKVKGIYIEDISEYYVSSKEEVFEIMKIGSHNRVQASTNMNENSSRSHSIFIVSLYQKNNKDKSAKASKLVLVDLAGSEKTSKTGATGLTLEEAKTINKSLTTLGMVINSLTDGKSSHIPYRESKLTRVLQESLGGNSKTCLIITCSPSVFNEAETLSTLRFGHRAKNIKNKPKINKEVTVSELQAVIEQLERKLSVAVNRIEILEDFIKKKGLELPITNIDISTIRQSLLPEAVIVKSDDSKAESGDLLKYIQLNEFFEKDIMQLTEQIKELQVSVQKKEIQLEDSSRNLISSEEVIDKLRGQLKSLEETYLNKGSNFNGLAQKRGQIKQQMPHLKENNLEVNDFIFEDSGNLDTQQSAEENVFTKFTNEIKAHENEKLFIIKALEEKSEKVAQQDAELKEMQDLIKIYESKLQPEDRLWAKKVITLEKNIEQLNRMYQQIVSQKGLIKCENQILTKKIRNKSDTISVLEKENSELREQLKLQTDFNKTQSRTTVKTPNVVKVLKGGILKQ